jgi:hypothetical protein
MHPIQFSRHEIHNHNHYDPLQVKQVPLQYLGARRQLPRGGGVAADRRVRQHDVHHARGEAQMGHGAPMIGWLRAT